METPGESPSQKDPIASAVDLVLARGDREIRIATPLGLGKPNALLNAIYRHFKADPSRTLTIATALSLQVPRGKSDLERRFLEPFTRRHFGENVPELEYAADLRDGKLPPNVKVQEFYFASGAMLGSERAQRDYVSINYTHVARDLVERAELHAIVQLVAKRGERYSLSCNPDVTLDLLDRIEKRGMRRPLVIGVVHPELPFLGGDADVDAKMFDAIVATNDAEQPLFAVPREPLDFASHAIGLHASTLVKDGGTLQIGIGALSDALVSALVLRHEKNSDYLAAVDALRGEKIADDPGVQKYGGTAPFETGLYGASEMVMDGFMHLRRAGILKRTVYDDAQKNSRGHYLKGAFFLGSKELYEWLRNLSGEDYDGIFMSRVSDVNQLYGGREELDARQRKDARFFNICMMATALGAAVSDALEDGRVVSGVGGQYNFVAMAHAIDGGRSALMFRSTREVGDRVDSNVKWNYGHTTIPRHLRDIFVTEYGVADLRGKSDEECVMAMLGVTDARFQEEIVRAAIRGKKLPHDFKIRDAWKANTPEALADKMRPLRARGLFARFPFGSDFTPIEQRLLPALAWLAKQSKSEDWGAFAGAIALPGKSADADACLERLGLTGSLSMKDRMLARLVRGALARTEKENA
jgi:acyl-CoA hydrolase